MPACLPALRQAASTRVNAATSSGSVRSWPATEAQGQAEVAGPDEQAVEAGHGGDRLAALEAVSRLDHREHHRLLGRGEGVGTRAQGGADRPVGAPAARRVAAGRHQRLGLGHGLDHGRDHAGRPGVQQVAGKGGVDAGQPDHGREAVRRHRTKRLHGRDLVEQPVLQVDGHGLGHAARRHHLRQMRVRDGQPRIARRPPGRPGLPHRARRCLGHRRSSQPRRRGCVGGFAEPGKRVVAGG